MGWNQKGVIKPFWHKSEMQDFPPFFRVCQRKKLYVTVAFDHPVFARSFIFYSHIRQDPVYVTLKWPAVFKHSNLLRSGCLHVSWRPKVNICLFGLKFRRDCFLKVNYLILKLCNSDHLRATGSVGRNKDGGQLWQGRRGRRQSFTQTGIASKVLPVKRTEEPFEKRNGE